MLETRIRSYFQSFQNSKYSYAYTLFIMIMFLSQFIFAYDEEKVIVLCLLSFAVLFYVNLNEVIHTALSKKSNDLEIEFSKLFKEKIIAMRRIHRYWRIFLDLEDNTVELYCWIKNNLKKTIFIAIKNRKFNKIHLTKEKYKLFFNKIFNIEKQINKSLFQLNDNNIKPTGFELELNWSSIFRNTVKSQTLSFLILSKLSFKSKSVVNQCSYMNFFLMNGN